MSPQSNVETLARIVTALGDDTSRPEDIEWVNEMPSGRDMLAWIASQLSAPEDAVHDDDDDILASLSAIALDDAELKLANDLSDDDELLSEEHLDRYISPIRLKAQIRCKNTEAELLEAEMDVLKCRIQQTRVANKKATALIGQRKKNIITTDKSLATIHERLTDVSSQTDGRLLAAKESAAILIDALADSCRVDYTSDLARLTRRRTAIVKRFQQIVTTGNRQAVHTADDLHEETARLDDVLQTLSKQITHTYEIKVDKVHVWRELSQAWNLDQLETLRAHEGALDSAVNALEAEVLNPLSDIQDELVAKSTLIADAEAVIGALAEELEEAVEDSEEAKQAVACMTGASDLRHANDLESRLKATLKSSEGASKGPRSSITIVMQIAGNRPAGSPPMILLNQQDILEEVQLRLKASADSAQQELVKANTLAAELRNFRSSHSALLKTVYANSPVNSSPPFAASATTSTAEQFARGKKDRLAEGAKLLSTELTMIDLERTQRHLDTFIKRAMQ
ncbi:hypothetical protein FB107DRAFT_268637 [Schizophyllum commune]